MKKLVLIALIMVMGLSGCASIAGPGLSWKDIKEDWGDYWKDPAGPGLSRKDIKGNWRWYLEDPAGPGLSWKDIKENWRWYLN
jgi:hypothetical protein